MSRKDIDYLDEERKKLWAEVVTQKERAAKVEAKIADLVSSLEALKEDVEKRTPDYEKEAKNASSQATRYKNKAAESSRALEEAASTVEGLAVRALEVDEQLSKINEFFGNSIQQHQEFTAAYSGLESTRVELATKADEIAVALEEAENALENVKGVSAKIGELKVVADAATVKIAAAHSQAVKRGNEINEIHDSVFGYTAEDSETGEDVAVNGLKSELEDAYGLLKKNLSDFGKDLTHLRDQKVVEFNEFSHLKSAEFEQIKDQIKGLLPDAMTAGLSHAYEEKRKSEEQEGKNAGKTYWRSICLLLVISCLPVIVSLYSFFHDGKKIDQIIQTLPQVVLATLPLYAPAFWFAISASKRIKLARRLTEEYAHKEALSKTFEGLSTQISNLPDSEISRELRVKLLYNIISVSSENPGKLISDYNNSDNPLLEVIDKSLSLSKSLEKIAAIPGVHRILRKVEQKREENLAKIEESVDENIPPGVSGRKSQVDV